MLPPSGAPNAHTGAGLPDPPHSGRSLCPQVPDAVDDCRGGEMDGPLLGPNPAKLAFASKAAPELAHVADDVYKGPADHQGCQGLDRLGANLISTADGERHAVTDPSVAGVGFNERIGGGVVRRLVHCIGA